MLKKGDGFKVRIIFDILFCIPIIYGCIFIKNANQSLCDKCEPTKTSISLDESKVNFKIDNVGFVNENGVVQFKCSNNSSYLLNTVDLFDKYAYITYYSSDMKSMYQAYVGRDKQGKWVTLNDPKKAIWSFMSLFSSKKKTGIDGANIYYEESYKKLYSAHYMLGYYTNKDNKSASRLDIIQGLKSGPYFEQLSGGKYDSKYINIDGIGDLDINELSTLSNNSGILYNGVNDFVQLYDDDNDYTVVFITSMNNMKLGNLYSNLKKLDGYSNVYVDKGWNDNSSFGYRGMAVMTNKGMYYFKFGEAVKDVDTFRNEFINWLGIKKTDTYIKTPEIIK